MKTHKVIENDKWVEYTICEKDHVWIISRGTFADLIYCAKCKVYKDEWDDGEYN
jgi:hypothetical protein